jgi:hypothetical protein
MMQRYLALVGLLVLIPAYAAAQSEAYGKDSIVRQADRILIESSDPEKLFKLFSDTLLFPIAWPLQTNGNYTNGSVSAGDVTLEFYRYGDGRTEGSEARCTWLYLEPFLLEEAVRRLRVQGIPYQEPEFNRSTLPDGSEGTAFTTVRLPSLSVGSLAVSLFEYSSQFLNMEVRRKQFGNRLTLNGGGPLGIVSMDTIVLESTEPERKEAEWARFVKNRQADGRLQPEEGPAFRIVPGKNQGIQKIVFKVKSLTVAEAFLREKRLLGSRSKEELLFAATPLQGLKISLKE